VFFDTEEVGGSNPPAPTRKLLVNGTHGCPRWRCLDYLDRDTLIGVVICLFVFYRRMRSMLGYAAVASAGSADPRDRRTNVGCRANRCPSPLDPYDGGAFEPLT
jgi:hypothetical protein